MITTLFKKYIYDPKTKNMKVKLLNDNEKNDSDKIVNQLTGKILINNI